MLYRVAEQHLIDVINARLDRRRGECGNCGAVSERGAKYCFGCGDDDIAGQHERRAALSRASYDAWVLQAQKTDWYKPPPPLSDFPNILPNAGIYVLYHKFEGYKIGQAEDVRRRVETLKCSAPSLQLLHVVETSDMDWCERFLHGRFRHRRKARNREYFRLTTDDLEWLFEINVLEPPKSEFEQLTLLELL